MREQRRNLSLGASLLKWYLGIFIAVLLGLVGGIRVEGVGFAGVHGTPATNKTSAQAAGPCIDKAKRYVDCGNGTVTDTATGLIWLKQANCVANATWEDAKKAAANLKNGDCMLTDGSTPGDWRLPTITEWEATMKDAQELKCQPTLTNDAGNACLSAGPSSFTGADSDYYWSSTAVNATRISFADLDHAHILGSVPTNSLRVWPVRGGQQ